MPKGKTVRLDEGEPQFGFRRKPIMIVGHRRPENVKDFDTMTISGKRLETLLGIKHGTLLDAVEAHNLLGPYEDLKAEKLQAAAALIDLDGIELLILCGKYTHAAFGWNKGPTIDTGEKVYVNGIPTCLLPHPTGRNRSWSDPALAAQCKAAMHTMVVGLIPPDLFIDPAEATAAKMAVARARKWKEEVVKRVLAHGVISVAARQTGISPGTVYSHMKRDPEFSRQVLESQELALDAAEAEVMRRAVAGFQGRPIVYTVQNAETGLRETKFKDVTEYSDQLLLRLLAAKRPELWSERRRTTVDGALTFRDLAAAADEALSDPEVLEETTD